jgi:hypothetical protein
VKLRGRRSAADFQKTRCGNRPRLGRRAHLAVLFVLQAVMMAELLLLIDSHRWMHAFLVIAIMAGIVSPQLLKRSYRVEIASELQIAATLFAFAALFLGEVRGYYERFWWWDEALHGTAGLLLGLLGFLVVDALNTSRGVRLEMRPSFVALFAFLFSLSLGTMWEIFEFAMDQSFGLSMQKPMLGDSSGLTDTMWDLIVDAFAAAIISSTGWRYMKGARRRYVDTWMARFIRRNQQLARRRSALDR